MARRWNVIPRRWKALGAVAALLLVSAVVPLQLATGQTPATPIAFDAGNLKLHMSTDASWFKYFDAGGNQVGGTQSFSASAKCGYTPGTNPNSLMKPTAVVPPNAGGSVVGYLQKDNGYGLGVNKAGKEGTGGCTQTNLSEQLTLELQNTGPTSPVKGLYIDSTNLDMEFKYNAVLNATYYRDGNPTPVGTSTHGCLNSDCGPDSGGGDNYRVNLHPTSGQPWDKVVLAVTSSSPQGAVTLEGGNDGTADSVFHLVKFLTPADCENAINGDGGGTHVTIHLLPNSGVCPDKGYSLDVTSRTITFETSGTSSIKSQWIVDVNNWSPSRR